MNEKRFTFFRGGGGSLWFPRNIASHAWPETSNRAENLNDCHYCPTNYSRSIIQPLFRVGNKEREHQRRCMSTTHTPIYEIHDCSPESVFIPAGRKVILHVYYDQIFIEYLKKKTKEKLATEYFYIYVTIVCKITWFIQKHIKIVRDFTR